MQQQRVEVSSKKAFFNAAHSDRRSKRKLYHGQLDTKRKQGDRPKALINYVMLHQRHRVFMNSPELRHHRGQKWMIKHKALIDTYSKINNSPIKGKIKNIHRF